MVKGKPKPGSPGGSGQQLVPQKRSETDDSLIRPEEIKTRTVGTSAERLTGNTEI
jgi:hypothetical protein